MMAVLGGGAVVLAMMWSGALSLIQTPSNTLQIVLIACAALCVVILAILVGTFVRSNFVVNVISIGRIIGIDSQEEVK